jgi:hypothetical protein
MRFLLLIVLFLCSVARSDIICRCENSSALCTTSSDCSTGGACVCQEEVQLATVDSGSGSLIINEIVEPQIVPTSDATFAGIVIGLGMAVIALAAFTVWMSYRNRNPIVK